MGNYISNNGLYLAAKRAASRYNSETRAFKEINRQKDKPFAAPHFDAEFIDYKKLLKENTDYLKATNTVDKALDDRLKEVYVTSTDETIPDQANRPNNPDKPLPACRTTEYFEIGYKESKYVPAGRVSILQAMKFITDHHKTPAEWPIHRITEEYKIKEYVADDIIKYFQAYEVFIPVKSDQKQLAASNKVPKDKQKQLSDNLSNKN